jgi:16S rRNA (guanine527-N7)-methyltransferase
LNSSEFRSRLIARAAHARVGLSPSEIDQLEAYFDLLTRWNRTINLTALRLDTVDSGTLDRLLVEPLAAARSVGIGPGRWIDLGSGGGSPAIPLKIVRPGWALTMVEARERKAAFLREAARDLALSGVEVLTARFETLRGRPDLAGLHLLVTVRAVKIDVGVLDLCRWLLAPGGRVFLFGVHDISHVQETQFKLDVVDLTLDGSKLTILSIANPSSSLFHVEHSD